MKNRGTVSEQLNALWLWVDDFNQRINRHVVRHEDVATPPPAGTPDQLEVLRLKDDLEAAKDEIQHLQGRLRAATEELERVRERHNQLTRTMRGLISG